MPWNGLLQIHDESAARPDAPASLTARERQVMSLIAEGLSNKEIAVRLGVAIHTVKTHVHNVLAKLALHTRLEVAVLVHAGDRNPRFAHVRQVA
jgi:DNA-binding NarL/FixJ family response regulator